MDQERQELEALAQIELYRYKKQAVSELVRSAARKYYRQLIAEDKPLPPVLKAAVSQFGKELFVSDTRGRKKNTRRWFITIGAKDPVDHYRFWTQMEKCIKKAQLLGTGKYVLEQRSEPGQEPYGWHIHWLVEFAEQSSLAVIKQQVYQCFKCYIAAANYIELLPIHDDAAWTAREKYISGSKKPEKMAKVQQDLILRARFGYPDLKCY